MMEEMTRGIINQPNEDISILSKEEIVMVGREDDESADLGRHIGPRSSWNRMRVHKQREMKKGADDASRKDIENAQQIMNQYRRDSTMVSPSSLSCSRADITSDEKLRKLHRRASDDALKKVPLRCCDLESSPSLLSRSLASFASSKMEEASPRTSAHDITNATILATAKGGKDTTHLVAQQSYGYDEPPLLSPQKRRRYSRRNSFVLRKNNSPFGLKNGACTTTEPRALEPMSSDDDLIKSLIEQVDAHQKLANSRRVEEALALVATPGGGRLPSAVRSKRTSSRMGSPPFAPLLTKDSSTQVLLDNEWANFSWSDSDDTKWYRLMSAMSFEPCEGKVVPASSSSAIKTSTTNCSIAISQGGTLPSSQTDQITGESGGVVIDLPLVTPQDYSLTSPPRQIEPVSCFKEQYIPDGVAADLLTEESPRTPRLLSSHNSRKRPPAK